jgi:hypothetical protein
MVAGWPLRSAGPAGLGYIHSVPHAFHLPLLSVPGSLRRAALAGLRLRSVPVPRAGPQAGPAAPSVLISAQFSIDGFRDRPAKDNR